MRSGLPLKVYLFFARYRRAMTLGVRAVVFDAGGRVLLLKHTYTPGWHFPGGGIEPRETAAEAVSRELEEEAGIALDGAPQLFGLYLNRVHSQRDHVAVFLCREWTQARELRLPNLEIIDCRFFSLDDLPDGTTVGTRRRLDEIVRERPRSADW